MRKLYKFFKDDCVPCRSLSAVLAQMDLPSDIEVVPIDVKEDIIFARNNGIVSVPTLMLENGNKLVGLKPVNDIIAFIKGG